MKYEKNDQVAGFTVQEVSYINEISAQAYIMQHDQTKAKLLFLATEDDNKVFSVTFRTPPADSTGVAHILEHSTLCGSDKYPLREPFVELVKGSLNTFLNAMTFPDKTMYPVASRNAKDFQNLMDVYLDAVFHPNLRKDPYILMQEGWHYELDDADQPLIYKGVVYNEMKGALSSPDDVLGQKAMEVLFPDTTYGYESGGDPDHIPELTFEAFTDFYQQYYHPSNAYFFLYGDMPLEETLTYISEKYLNEYHYREIDSEIATQSAPTARQKATFYYGVTEDEERQGKTLHAIDIVLPDTLSPAQMMAMEVWNYALLTIPGAPLRQEIISKGLATDVSGSIIDSLKQAVWHIEAIGSEREHQASLVQLFDAFMQKIAAQGFSSELLSAALNRLEFSLRENDFNGRPKGLFYNLRALDFWLYDRDPLQGLRYEEDIRELREEITAGTFHTIIGDLICRNPHKAVITMAPQVGLQEEKEQAVREKLAAFKETLSPEKERRIIEQTATLKRRQQTADNEEQLATIPLLERDELPQKVDSDALLQEDVEGFPVYRMAGDSNGILYATLYFPLLHLTTQEYLYAVLLSDVLGELDTRGYTYAELAQQINFHTGGITVGLKSGSRYDDDRDVYSYFVVRGKALTSNTSQLVTLTNELINHTLFTDTKRLTELINEKKTDWNLQLFRRGNALMMNRALSYVSPLERLRDQSGLSYFAFLQKLAQHSTEEIITALQQTSRRIFRMVGSFALICGGEEESTAWQQESSRLLADLEQEKSADAPLALDLHIGNEGFISVGKVQYVAQGGNFRREGHTYHGALTVLEHILRYEYLWQNVRILGGAYGAHAQIMSNGNSVFCSYRDPNLAETLQVYADMPAAIGRFEATDRAMRQYVIGALAPTQTQFTLPMRGERAVNRMLSKMPDTFRQQIRDEIIHCTQSDIRAQAPLLQSIIAQQHISVMGGATKLNEQRELFRDIINFGK